MNAMNNVVLGVVAAGVLWGVAGCKSMEEYRMERAEYAIKHFEGAKYQELMEGRKLTLGECVKLAAEHNLDIKVLETEAKVAKEMETAEMLGMLPELNISETYTGRSNIPASSSKNVFHSAAGTYSYSTSQDRDINVFNIDLALSVLDFGLAYFNAQQARDRVFIRQQRTERARQNLTLDVVRAYFSVAAAQRAIKITTGLLKECQDRYNLIEKLGKTGQIDAFRAFDETRRFVDMEKRLTNYIRSYDNNCVELRSLLGLHPSGRILVEDSYLSRVPEVELPDIDLMEQIALLKRPELFEIDIQKHITSLDVRKEIVMMFPNVRIFADFTNSDNSYLYHASWYELGVRAAYNLLKLPVHLQKALANHEQVKVEEQRAFAQAIAVMAQVRIAHANLLATRERYDISNKIHTAFSDNLKTAQRSQKVAGELSNLEVDHIRLETAETEIERMMTLGSYYVSYYRMLNAVGIRSVSSQNIAEIRQELEAARKRAAKELDQARRKFQENMRAQSSSGANAELAALEHKVADQPLTNFGEVDFVSMHSAGNGRKSSAGNPGK